MSGNMLTEIRQQRSENRGSLMIMSEESFVIDDYTFHFGP